MLKLLFLPPHSPHLNLHEAVAAHAKRNAAKQDRSEQGGGEISGSESAVTDIKDAGSRTVLFGQPELRYIPQ